MSRVSSPAARAGRPWPLRSASAQRPPPAPTAPAAPRMPPRSSSPLQLSSESPTRTATRRPPGPDAARTSSSGSLDHGRFLPGTLLTGRYRIIGLLWRGGMGEVYRADDLKLGQAVALKFLKLARQVSHPNVCRVYDVQETDGRHFLSMEFVDGEDLATLLRRIGRLPRDKAVQIARTLCASLAAP